MQDPDVFSADPVGSLSATCTANPYAGITQTFLALSQGGALATDSVGADSVQAVGAGVGVALKFLGMELQTRFFLPFLQGSGA